MGGEDASARRPSDDPRQHVRWLNRLRDDFVSTGSIAPTLRRLVTESWQRSVGSGIDPEHSLAPVRLDDDTLDELRAAHPLEAAMPVIRRLLVDDAVDAGLLVAVSDAAGQLLWVEGDRELRARAEHMNFVPGADWSEHSAGTNAPGTALALGAPVQIVGAEHLLRPVTPWSCSAAPIREPDTGAVLGVIDVTGGDEAAGPTALALVRATVAAVEAELRLSRLIGPTAQRSAGTAGQPRLETLGRRNARLSQGDTSADLSLRHSEIVLLLSHAPDGLSSAELAVELSDDDQSMVTVRAELSRLRAQLAPLMLQSRPYRLAPLTSDVAAVGADLDAGLLRRAVARYLGPVLPTSSAPGVVRLRDDLHRRLRGRLLAGTDPDALLAFADTPFGRDDLQLWQRVLTVLAPSSPRRPEVVQHLRALDLALR